MQRFSKSFGLKLMVGLLGLGVTVGAGTSRAGEGSKEMVQAPSGATRAVALTSIPGDNVSYSYKGKKVLVRLLNVKDRDWIGECIDEDNISITVQINNNVFRFFYGDIEYIEAI